MDEIETKHVSEKPISERRVCIRGIRWVGAALCLSIFIAIWITLAEALQAVGKNYQKPFFQCYWMQSFYSVLYVIWKLWIVLPEKWFCNKAGEGSLSNFKSLVIASGVLALLLYMSTCLWYLSLPRISVSANTAIYQSSSAVVFIISVPLLRERVTLLKIASVCLTIAGVCIVSFFGQSHHQTTFNETLHYSGSSELDEKGTPLGYVFVVASMTLYACYTTGYKKFATKPGDPAMVQNGVRVLGYIGVHTLLWMWPVLILLHFTGVEQFKLPTLHIFKLLVLYAFLDMIFKSAIILCIALSSPLFTTVGAVFNHCGLVDSPLYPSLASFPWHCYHSSGFLLSCFLRILGLMPQGPFITTKPH